MLGHYCKFRKSDKLIDSSPSHGEKQTLPCERKRKEDPIVERNKNHEN